MAEGEWIHKRHGIGQIAWRLGIGGSAEITNLDVDPGKRRQGHGRMLVFHVLKHCRGNPPHAVYGFTSADNDIAHRFYGALGFLLFPVRPLCPGGAVLFCQEYAKLMLQMERIERGLAGSG